MEACETKSSPIALPIEVQPLVDTAATVGEYNSKGAQSSLMRWCFPGKESGAPEDVVSYHERILLETWTKIGTADDPSIQLNMTDRTGFIERRRHINEKTENGVDVLNEDQNMFVTFLRADMQFPIPTGPPSPLKKWPPPRHQRGVQ